MRRLKVSWRRPGSRGRCGFARIASCPTTGTSCFGPSVTETWPLSCSNSPPSTCDVGSCTAGEWVMGMSTKVGTSRSRSRNKSISISLCAMWSAMRYARPWSSEPRLGGGRVFGDEHRARRSKSNCSAIGRWLIRRTGASLSTNRKRRRRWTRFVAVWPAVRRTAEQLGLESTLRAPHRPRKVTGNQ